MKEEDAMRARRILCALAPGRGTWGCAAEAPVKTTTVRALESPQDFYSQGNESLTKGENGEGC